MPQDSVLSATREWSPDELRAVSQELEGAEPQEVLRWAIGEFFPQITLACSFGGVSGMALLDMAVKIEPRIKVFYLDTDFLFPEAYALRDKASAKYRIQPSGFKSLLTPAEQAAQYGEALWDRDPDLCCELRKVEPNVRALSGQQAWVAGLRRDQGDTRREVGIVERDTKFNMVKVNPLANWTEKQVWSYIMKHEVPYNPLHDQGYPSIGCMYCTRAVRPGEDPRAGRWSGFDKDECGIHVSGDEIVAGES